MEAAAYRDMLASQKTHWWFRARRRILGALLRRFVPPGGRVLEVGAGTGGNLALLAGWGAVTAVEPNAFAVEHLRRHFADHVEVVHSAVPAKSGHPTGNFHLVAALDVLEHIEDDTGALEFIAKSLMPGGWLLLTVPAFEFLYSSHDEVLHHKRRYRLGEIVAKIDAAGLAVAYRSYYNCLLFLPAVIVRLADRARRGRSTGSAPGGSMDGLLGFVFGLESKLVGRVALPFGLSIVVLAQKPT